MSLTSEIRLLQYTIGGSGQTLPVTFKFFLATDLKVVKTVAGVDTTLVLSTDYSVSGGGTSAAAGSITLVAGTAGDIITIYGAEPFTQATDLENNGPLPASGLTAMVDRLTILAQQLRLDIGRALRIPKTNAVSSTPEMTLANRAGKVVSFDGNGNLAFLPPASAVFATGTTIQVAAVSALKSIVVTSLVTGMQASLSGYTTAGDGGGGLFTYDSTSSATDDGGSVITPNAGSGRWLRVVAGDLTPEMFGLKGDGSTDDFPAWKKLVTYINAQGGGTLRCTRGKTYFLGQHIVSGNGVTNAIFRNLNGFVLEGNGAVIKVQGGFNRAATSTATLSGLVFFTCANVIVRNLELDGNNATITKGGGVGEAFAYGLFFGGCVGVTAENVYSHHWITDGTCCDVDDSAGPYAACQRVHFKNVRSVYNARQALTITQLRVGLFENCDFSYTGRSSYGNHSPAAGIDIEPGRTTPDVDINTGEITIQNCRIVANQGHTIDCGYPLMTDNVRVIDCYCVVDSTAGSPGTQDFIFSPNGGCIRGGYIDTADRGFYPCVGGGTANCVVEGVTIKGNANALRCLEEAALVIKNCRIISTKTDPSQTDYAVYISNTKCVFSGNYVFIPKEGWADNGSGRCLMFRGDNIQSAEDNVYETDLADAGHYFYGGMGATTGNTRNERYIGQIPGTADTIRPYLGGYDTTKLYAVGLSAVGGLSLAGNSSLESRRMVVVTAIPSTGTWFRGDIAWFNDPSAGGSPGWVCTASGSPGTWKAMANLAA